MTQSKSHTELTRWIKDRLADASPSPETYQAVLEEVLARFDCVVGTIHLLDPATGKLRLLAQKGVPEAILDRVQQIPVGKGMAGLAAERREPVQICNLQTDESGQAKSAARSTQMEGSISVPMLCAGELKGVIGIAKPTVYEYSQDEIDLLKEIARLIGETVEGFQ